MSTQRIDALTGIRPFASFAVFFFHFGRPLVAGAPGPLRALGGAGFVAVSFFYVLSGFVLTLASRRALVAGTLDRRRFFVRRAARIIPTALLALALLVPLALHPAWGRASGAFPAGGPPLALTGLLHLTLLQAWLPSLALTWNLPAWSVSVELAFYLVFPALAGALVASSRRTAWLTMGGAWALSLAATAVYSLLLPDGHGIGPDSNATWIDVLKFWPPARLPEIVFGVALGAIYRPGRPGARVPRWLGPVALAALVALLTQAERIPFALLHNALLMPLFGALLVAVASARGTTARLLSLPPLVLLGRAGYAIYILQMPLMYYLMLATSAGFIDWRGAVFFGRFLVLLVAAALLVHLRFERPLQAWLQRRLGRALGERAGNGDGVDAELAQIAAHGIGIADEMQARRRRVGGGAVDHGQAALVEEAERADQRLQPATVAGSSDHL
jgi:peptidoglycan/LPS O-acetylase OafA/YrhL